MDTLKIWIVSFLDVLSLITIGFILSTNGIGVDTWQFWAILVAFLLHDYTIYVKK